MLGERILELRTAHNWTQVQLAQKLNVSKQAVSNWENNNILPSRYHRTFRRRKPFRPR